MQELMFSPSSLTVGEGFIAAGGTSSQVQRTYSWNSCFLHCCFAPARCMECELKANAVGFQTSGCRVQARTRNKV